MTQIPEGRQPMQSDDMAKLHPSTWEQQCAQLVAEKAELALQATIALSERDELLAENKRLKLELHEASEAIDAVWFALDDSALDLAADAVQAFFKARAALQKQEGE